MKILPIALLLVLGCGSPEPPKNIYDMAPPPPPPPCADGSSGSGLDPGDKHLPTVCPGTPQNACTSNSWVPCEVLSQIASDRCSSTEILVLGAKAQKDVGTVPSLVRCPSQPTTRARTTFWRACGNYSRPTAGYIYTLQFPCGNFPRSVDCEYLDAAHCEQLPAGLNAKTACCLVR